MFKYYLLVNVTDASLSYRLCGFDSARKYANVALCGIVQTAAEIAEIQEQAEAKVFIDLPLSCVLHGSARLHGWTAVQFREGAPLLETLNELTAFEGAHYDDDEC